MTGSAGPASAEGLRVPPRRSNIGTFYPFGIDSKPNFGVEILNKCQGRNTKTSTRQARLDWDFMPVGIGRDRCRLG